MNVVEKDMTTRSRKNCPSAREVLKLSSTSPNASPNIKEEMKQAEEQPKEPGIIEVNLSLSQQGYVDAAVRGAASHSQYVDAAIYELKKKKSLLVTLSRLHLIQTKWNKVSPSRQEKELMIYVEQCMCKNFQL